MLKDLVLIREILIKGPRILQPCQGCSVQLAIAVRKVGSPHLNERVLATQAAQCPA